VAQPGPARPRPAQHARPTVWPSSARRERARGSVARVRCGGDFTSAREVAREKHGGASPARGWQRGRAGGRRWRRAGGTTRHGRWHDTRGSAVSYVRRRWRGSTRPRRRENSRTRGQDGVDGGVGRGRQRRRRGRRRGALGHAGGSTRGEASSRAVGAWTRETTRSGRQRVRQGGREAVAVDTDARSLDSAFKVWCAARGSHAATADRWAPHVNDFRIKIYSQTKIAQNK
jgi:hypothetical protein